MQRRLELRHLKNGAIKFIELLIPPTAHCRRLNGVR